MSYLSGARRSFTVRGATTFRLTVRFTSSALGPLVRLAVPSRASHTQCARGTSPYFLALVVWWGLQYQEVLRTRPSTVATSVAPERGGAPGVGMWGPPILQEEIAAGTTRPEGSAPSQNGSSTVCIYHTRSQDTYTFTLCIHHTRGRVAEVPTHDGETELKPYPPS